MITRSDGFFVKYCLVTANCYFDKYMLFSLNSCLK